MKNEEQDWINRLKKGAGKELKDLYILYKEEFVAWSSSTYKIREEEAIDIFQDAVITFYWNVKKGKLSELTSSLKTYLFAIGKNLALKKLKKDSRMVVDNDLLKYSVDEEIDPINLEATDRQKKMVAFLKTIGEPCKSILNLFYFHRYSMASIAQQLDYKNEHVVKAQKLRCLKKLKSLLEKQQIGQGDI